MAQSPPPPLVLGAREHNAYRIGDGAVDATRPSPQPRVARLAALPLDLRIDLNKAAVIVIDMQNDFCSRSGLLASLGIDISGARALFDPIGRVTAAARTKDVPVIWLNWGVRRDLANLSPGTRFTFSAGGRFAGLGMPLPAKEGIHEAYHLLVSGEWGAAIVDELTPEPGDFHVDKHRISGFWDTPLDSILRNLDVKTLFFLGVNSDHCVMATLMDANFKGYDTILVEDCTATTSPDFCHQATLHNVRSCFGCTATSDGFVEALG